MTTLSGFKARVEQVRRMRGCQTPGCTKPVVGLSTYCASHHRALTIYGHPLARLPDRKAFAPYIEAAETFLHRERHHAGIQEATQWIASRIAEGEHRTARRGRTIDPRNAHQRLDKFWAQMASIGPSRVFATIIGVYAYERDHAAAFLDRNHFAATICHFLLRLAFPSRALGERSAGGAFYADKARGLTTRARQLWQRQVLDTLGGACRTLAKPVAASMKAPPAVAAFSDLSGADE